MQKSRQSRSYRQYSPLARALDRLGERWTLLLLAELLTGPKRYSDLLSALPGIGTNLLAARLQALEREGLIERLKLRPPAASTVYTLSGLAHELEPVLMGLFGFGARYLAEPPTDGDRVRLVWVLLGLAANVPQQEIHEPARYEFRFGEEIYSLAVDPQSIRVSDGPATNPSATMTLEDPLVLLQLGSTPDPPGTTFEGATEKRGQLLALLTSAAANAQQG
jgi:DNA-binding HxlR family transcriptional regulator